MIGGRESEVKFSKAAGASFPTNEKAMPFAERASTKKGWSTPHFTVDFSGFSPKFFPWQKKR
jgi:hypothetical protein